ncbi:MAG: conjugal transfer protein TraD [Legionellaceae bacterium]|nr:conjugal transfer protein TraD [Legionellaceae bacterium]
MELNNQIKKQEQRIARVESSLALEKLKKRRADTRRKIELGGLVVKSGIDGFNKSVILGALMHALQSIEKEESYQKIFESIGDAEFLKD